MARTLGQQRVRIDFNVMGSSIVDHIKSVSANLIDLINEIPSPAGLNPSSPERGEFLRLKAIAMTEVETAAMYAVKAATFDSTLPPVSKPIYDENANDLAPADRPAIRESKDHSA